jgi:hypothetical protein
MCNSFELPLEIRTQYHLQGQFQLQLYLPHFNILIKISINSEIDNGSKEIANMMLMQIFQMMILNFLYIALSDYII